MEQLISQLIEVDKQARARVSRAKKERAKALETVDTQRKEMEARYAEQLEALIATERAAAEQAKAEAAAEVEAKKDALIAGLDAVYRENADAWVSQIVAAVLD